MDFVGCPCGSFSAAQRRDESCLWITLMGRLTFLTQGPFGDGRESSFVQMQNQNTRGQPPR